MAYNELDTRYSSGQLRVLAFAPTFQKHPLEEKTYAAGILSICKPSFEYDLLTRPVLQRAAM